MCVCVCVGGYVHKMGWCMLYNIKYVLDVCMCECGYIPIIGMWWKLLMCSSNSPQVIVCHIPPSPVAAKFDFFEVIVLLPKYILCMDRVVY